MLQPKILSVRPLSGCRLLLAYENGEHREFDVSPYATGPWYGRLSDQDYFSLVRVLPDGSGIEWPEGQDIAPHELYERGRKIAGHCVAS